MFRNEQKEYIKNIKEEESNDIDRCENPICISNAVSLVEVSREYDKLLIENIKLKRENLTKFP